MAGALYQLYARNKFPVRAYFPVNGPYDTHGYVVKVIRGPIVGAPNPEKHDPYKDYYLHLIRGTGEQVI